MKIQSIADFAVSSDGLQKIKNIKIIAFDFDGVFTDNRVCVSEKGEESVFCSRADGIGLSRIKQVGLFPIIISSETNSVTQKRADKLGIECFYGVVDKAEVAQTVLDRCKFSIEELAFVCNDINDIPLARKASVTIGVQDSWPEILDFCDAITFKNGGQGAVREVCDIFYNIDRS